MFNKHTHAHVDMEKQTLYNVNDLICEISFTTGESFKHQLLNDESFKILSGLYGKYTNLRPIIEEKLTWLLQDFDEQYYKTALATMKVGALILDVKYNGAVTV